MFDLEIQPWDIQQLYIYALLGDFTELSADNVSKCLINLTRDKWSIEYSCKILAKLERTGIISVSDIKFKELDVYNNSLEMQVSRKVHFMAPKGYNLRPSVIEEVKDRLSTEKTLVSFDDFILQWRIYASVEPFTGSIAAHIRCNDKEWFRRKVKHYLAMYAADKLYSPDGDDLQPYSEQLLAILEPLGSTKRTVSLQDIIPTIISSDPSFRLLESLVSLAQNEKLKILTLSLEAPVSLSGIPHVKAKLRQLELDNVTLLPGTPNDTKSNDNTSLVEVKLEGLYIFLYMQNKAPIQLKKLRVDNGLFNFMTYLFRNSNRKIGRGEINIIDGCKAYTDMTEIVRKCGFDSVLKEIFFQGTTSQTVLFMPKQLVNDSQYSIISNRFESSKTD
jgi:hypothetical protein